VERGQLIQSEQRLATFERFKFVDGAFGVARGRLSGIQIRRPNREFVFRSSPLTALQVSDRLSLG
jgi:hypothetical protein